MRGCVEEREAGPFCAEHWAALPEDLQYRVQWAHEDGTDSDWTAAINAAVRFLSDE
jgi:hypothetical protein